MRRSMKMASTRPSVGEAIAFPGLTPPCPFAGLLCFYGHPQYPHRLASYRLCCGRRGGCLPDLHLLHHPVHGREGSQEEACLRRPYQGGMRVQAGDKEDMPAIQACRSGKRAGRREGADMAAVNIFLKGPPLIPKK
jgi:hypothetical protein